MTTERLYDILGGINETQVREARIAASRAKKPRWTRWGAAAACLCLAAALFALPALREAAPEAPGAETESDPAAVSRDGPPHLVLDGIAFYISPHLSASKTLPDGFSPGGTAEVNGVGDCSYYLNPDIPEWVYVRQEVRTDGTLDETGTLIPTEPHVAYVRYVDERLRGRDLLSCDGRLYISMWSANCYGGDPDVSSAFYDEIYDSYGIRIEGGVPEGFLSAGVAEFSGDDTIPSGALSSNKEAAEVLVNPDDPDVVLAATQWYTAAAGEDGETRHEGYNVYLLYDGPLNRP